MKKFLKVLALALALGLGGFTGSAQADWEAGDRVVLGAYCNLTDADDFMVEADRRSKELRNAILTGGWKGYAAWIAIPDNCMDARLRRTPVVSGMLLEKLSEFAAEGGEVIEMWLWRDDTGQPGLTWLSPNDHEPKGQGA